MLSGTNEMIAKLATQKVKAQLYNYECNYEDIIKLFIEEYDKIISFSEKVKGLIEKRDKLNEEIEALQDTCCHFIDKRYSSYLCPICDYEIN